MKIPRAFSIVLLTIGVILSVNISVFAASATTDATVPKTETLTAVIGATTASAVITDGSGESVVPSATAAPIVIAPLQEKADNSGLIILIVIVLVFGVVSGAVISYFLTKRHDTKKYTEDFMFEHHDDIFEEVVDREAEKRIALSKREKKSTKPDKVARPSKAKKSARYDDLGSDDSSDEFVDNEGAIFVQEKSDYTMPVDHNVPASVPPLAVKLPILVPAPVQIVEAPIVEAIEPVSESVAINGAVATAPSEAVAAIIPVVLTKTVSRPPRKIRILYSEDGCVLNADGTKCLLDGSSLQDPERDEAGEIILWEGKPLYYDDTEPFYVEKGEVHFYYNE